MERATGFFALHHRRAHQRLRARFVRGVWLHTEDYLASAPAGVFGRWRSAADPGGRTVIHAPTFMPAAPADPISGQITVHRRPRQVVELVQPWVIGVGGAVVGRDRRLLWDLSYEWPGRPHAHSSYALSDAPAVDLPGTTVALTAMGAEKNHFHFLLNGLARLAYLPAPAAREPDRYLVSGEVTPFVRDALAVFGVPPDRVIGTADFPATRPAKLIAPPLVQHPFVVPAHICDFVRESVLELLPPRRGGRRLFIDRGDAPTRRVANLDELRPLLAEFGIVPIQLTGLSLAAQAQLFHDADLVIANHGAALANLVFSEPGTRVLQLLAPGMMEREYRTISQHRRLRHDYLVAPFASSSDADRPRKDRDLVLPPALLRRVLEAERWRRV